MDYMIPKNVDSRFEFFTGFGWRELFITLAGVAVGFLLFFGIGLLISHLLIRLIVLVIPAFVAFLASAPNPRSGKALMDYFKDLKIYKSKQKRYFYRFGEGRIKHD